MRLPPKQHRPYWLWQTKRLFPNRIVAACVSFASILVGLLCVGVATGVAGCWPMAIPSLLFFAIALATLCAVVTEPNSEYTVDYSGSPQTEAPTFAIIISLIGIYSWMLSLAMHFFKAFFNGLTPTKYYLTLGIAISSTLYMYFFGKRVMIRHFGENQDLRELEISAGQAFYVVIFIVGCGAYFVWLTV